MPADQPTRDSLPAEHLHADEPTVDGSAREAEAGQDVAGTQDDPAGTRERDAAVPASDEVAPTTDAPDVAAAVEESGGEGLVD